MSRGLSAGVLTLVLGLAGGQGCDTAGSGPDAGPDAPGGKSDGLGLEPDDNRAVEMQVFAKRTNFSGFVDVSVITALADRHDVYWSALLPADIAADTVPTALFSNGFSFTSAYDNGVARVVREIEPGRVSITRRWDGKIGNDALKLEIRVETEGAPTDFAAASRAEIDAVFDEAEPGETFVIFWATRQGMFADVDHLPMQLQIDPRVAELGLLDEAGTFALTASDPQRRASFTFDCDPEGEDCVVDLAVHTLDCGEVPPDQDIADFDPTTCIEGTELRHLRP